MTTKPWVYTAPLTPGVALTILRERTSGPLDQRPDRYWYIYGYCQAVLEEVRTIADCRWIAKALGVTRPARMRQKIANQIARHTTGYRERRTRHAVVGTAQ
jgi:hypothetical protein